MSDISPKVVVQTLVAVVLPAVLAALLYLPTQSGRALFAELPPVLIVVGGALLTGLVSFLAGYFIRDPFRNHSKIAAEDEDDGVVLPFADEQARINELTRVPEPAV